MADSGTLFLVSAQDPTVGVSSRPGDARFRGFHFLPADDLRHRVERFHIERVREDEERLHDLEVHHRALVHALRTERLRDQDVDRGMAQVRQAAEHGLREQMIIRFPNELCTDGGRAINNDEPDWPETLTGIPRQLYDMWRDQLRGLGYRLTAQIVDFPNGMPGDIGFFLHWD